MTKNKIEDVRDHLFATLEGLLDKDAPLPLDRAEAIVRVSQTIINSAKVEVDFLKLQKNATGTGFIPAAPRGPQPLAAQEPIQGEARRLGGGS